MWRTVKVVFIHKNSNKKDFTDCSMLGWATDWSLRTFIEKLLKETWRTFEIYIRRTIEIIYLKQQTTPTNDTNLTLVDGQFDVLENHRLELA